MEQNPKTTDSKNFTYTPHTTWVETFDKQPRLLRNSGSASVANPLTYGPCRPSRLSDYVAYKSRRPGPCLRYGDIEQPNAPQQRIFKQDTSTGLPKRLLAGPLMWQAHNNEFSSRTHQRACSNLSARTLRFRNQMPAEQIRPSQPKRNLDYLILNERSKVEIFRKFLNRKSGRELFKHFKGKIVSVTGSTYFTDEGKVIRRNHLAVRLKSTGLSFSGKQATPVKKGQKRPIVSSSSLNLRRR